jgi:hypothetical protein
MNDGRGFVSSCGYYARSVQVKRGFSAVSCGFGFGTAVVDRKAVKEAIRWRYCPQWLNKPHIQKCRQNSKLNLPRQEPITERYLKESRVVAEWLTR